MTHGAFRVPPPVNEPVKGYGPGSPEKRSLKAKLAELASTQVEIPVVIGGREVRTGRTETITMPHDHRHVLGRFHQAGPDEVRAAIDAAEMLATTHRDLVNGATMLGQSKTVHQAEIDSACELIDFWRYNPWYAQRLYEEQPLSAPGAWNRLEHRPLDGYVFAVTPFNFTSIGGNLPTAPALLGNTVVWKPASTSVYSNWFVFELLREAGLPPGVINFLPGPGAAVGEAAVADRRLGGIHFTGSTGVFDGIWASVGANRPKYGQYPRLVGETGGKDFVFAHASADPRALAVALVRGAFEYQGQKCSAASRAYVPRSLWDDVRQRLGAILAEVRMGDVRDFRNFMGAVIDRRSFEKLKAAIDAARACRDVEVVWGGECDASQGWFVQPTILEARDPRYDTMCTELFGPVLTLHVYEDARYAETLALCDATSEYALTGAVFATDRRAIREATERLRFAAGNFYVNDKPTGAVVGQQPFGGSRGSGTNDKAGSILNLLRWTSPRAIKETLVPPRDWRYPFLAEE